MKTLRQTSRSIRLALSVIATALALAVGSLIALTVAPAAHADTQICDQYGSTTIQGRYVVQNNRWGTTATQCINVTNSGFQITQADGTATGGAPKSYPSVFNGCHYTNCSPGTSLPAQLSAIGSAPTSVSFSYVGNAVYDASYDIWLDPTPRKDGVNKTEIMVWYNHTNPVQPVGSRVGTASVAGRSWDVWTGNNGSNDVISFVAPSAIASWSFDVKAFANEAISRGLAQNSWYLTSVQAGFEPWQNGVGLAVTSFSSSVNLGGSTSGGSTSGGGTGGSGGTGSASCKVAFAPQTWSGGYTANVTVTNTGSTALNNWKAGFTLHSGQTITSAWNATISPSSGSVTATNLSFNAQIPAGGSQSFGFQGTYSGTYSQPTGFTLNGASCS
ncbi:GH12 family glycosyl hydrolase domain-containing protein [Streptomyces sp. NBC_01190]|uniref:GH12 family glycosyl hydrolase domain-containing protein n=1 Tax=Streptomyces sp. NBC_01190 TaxID=2903767 RepID=UPI003865A1E4|nr:cellulose binding domain-containing protein [Streptomyces sp. NBC_01190]